MKEGLTRSEVKQVKHFAMRLRTTGEIGPAQMKQFEKLWKRATAAQQGGIRMAVELEAAGVGGFTMIMPVKEEA
jgi:hypothetical protein